MSMQRYLTVTWLTLIVGCGFPEPSDVSSLKVEFELDRSVADEGGVLAGTQLDVKVRLDETSLEPVVVVFEVGGGDAVRDADFEIVGGSNLVTIDPNEQRGSILINVKHDGDEEQDETIDLTLVSAEGAELGAQTTHIVTISADLLPRLQFATDASSASEGTETRMIMLTLDKASSEDVVVDYALVAGGTATPGADHEIEDGTLTIPANMTSAVIPVTIVDDDLDEFDESFAIVLRTRASAVVGTVNMHTHTIIDEDDLPTVGFVNPGGGTAEAGTANIDVTLSTTSGRQVTVDFSVVPSGSIATGGGVDFTLVDGTLTFPAGTKTLPIQVAVTPDLLDEVNEFLAIGLSNPGNATLSLNDAHTLVINDDDTQPLVRFDPSQGDRDVDEGDFGSAAFIYPVRLTAMSGRAVTVNVTVTGSADDSDFSIAQGDLPVTFLPGETTKSIRVIVNGDSLNELSEDVRLTLSTPTGATLASDNLVRQHRIRNDDQLETRSVRGVK